MYNIYVQCTDTNQNGINHVRVNSTAVSNELCAIAVDDATDTGYRSGGDDYNIIGTRVGRVKNTIFIYDDNNDDNTTLFVDLPGG